MGILTLLDVNCKEDIDHFLIQNFKLNKVELPWMYDHVGEFNQVVNKNKKCSTFNHKSCPHIEYFSNQNEKDIENSPKWEFCVLKKLW